MDFLLHIGHWSANVRRVCLMLRGDEVITDDRVRSYYVQLARRLILHRSRRFNQTGHDIYEREQLTMRNERGEENTKRMEYVTKRIYKITFYCDTV